MGKKIHKRKYNEIIATGLVAIILLTLSSKSFGQEPPPRPIRITVTAQQLTFGAFTHGAAGGTVTVSPAGMRFSTGDVVLLDLGYPYYPTVYEIMAIPGTVVSILNGPDAILTGSNGGSITLTIGSSDPPSPFVISPPFPNLISIGGTITIGNSAANPPGAYSGTYDIIFVQE
ncbi:MAG: DUF4402 domain-containing protein [Bacteroidales bacterium]|nr:DUF4402 domain-containing protein [Bacteroidales bacterium]